MRLIDTHAHLDFPYLHDQLDDILEAAREQGVERIVAIGASRGIDSNWRAQAIASAHDHIRCTAGIHPHDAGEATEEWLETLRDELVRHEQVVAVGEAGLDYYYDTAPKEAQHHVFREQLKLSRQVSRPIVIHSREAEEDTLKLLDEEGVTGGILHCFTGTRPFAEELLERDFYISFSGIVTFKNGRELLEIARDVPADRILVETDSPYLAPVPRRGKKNQPAFVRHTAEKIAEIRGESLDDLAAAVWENAERVFGWS